MNSFYGLTPPLQGQECSRSKMSDFPPVRTEDTDTPPSPPTIFGKLLLPQDFLDGSSCKLFSSNDLPENYSYQMVYPWSSADSGILIPYYGM